MTILSSTQLQVQDHVFSWFYFFFSLPLCATPTFQMGGLMFIDRTESDTRNSHQHLCSYKLTGRPVPCSLLFLSYFIPFITQLLFHQVPHFTLPLASATLCPSACQKLLSPNLTGPSPFLQPATLALIFFFPTPHALPGRSQPQQ